MIGSAGITYQSFFNITWEKTSLKNLGLSWTVSALPRPIILVILMAISPTMLPPLQPTEPASPSPSPIPALPLSRQQLPRHHRIRWTVLSISAIVLIVVVVAGWVLYRAIAVVNTKALDGSNRRVGFFQQLTHLITRNDQQLNGEADDRVNVLLLGIGGPGHDGPYLTDTMMVVSYKPSIDQLAMISVPRDLVVDIPGYDYRKINNVLSIGRDNDYPGGGEALTVKVVSDLLDIPIQYYARVDFKGFEEVIDRVGGVNVTVNTTFYDSQYPDNDYGYAPISFKAGRQTMSGATALKFARSRHGSNGEGSDFARAARQQKIIYALKEKFLSFGTLSNPLKISDILTSLGTRSQTNMEVWEMIRLAKLAGDVPSGQVVNRVIDSGPDGLVKNATGLAGAAILVPSDDTYADMKFFARNIFLLGRSTPENTNVIVVNATGTDGQALRVAKSLASFGFKTSTATLPATDISTTLIVNPAAGQSPATAQLLAQFVRARGTLTLAQWESQTSDTTLRALLTPTPPKNTNSANTNTAPTNLTKLIVVLGQDQPKTAPISFLKRYFGPSTVVIKKSSTTKLP